MSWATCAIERLRTGESVEIRPRGHSMAGVISSGDRVELRPVKFDEIEKGDAVLCRVNGTDYLHRVKSVDTLQRRALIENARGHINGWAREAHIYGVAVRVAGKFTKAHSRLTKENSDDDA